MLSLSFQTTSDRNSIAASKMKLVLLIVFCAVIAKTYSENGYGRPYGPYMQQGYPRIKRLKYSSPPQRFYSRPPSSFPFKGAYSKTPPPYPGNSRPKVSKRPSEGLKENDLQNFVKYLSKQDLDKILEYAGHNKDSDSFRNPYDKQIYSRPTDDNRNIYNSIQDPEPQKPNEDESQIFKSIVHEIDWDPKTNLYQEKDPSFKMPTNNEPNPIPFKDYNHLANYVTDPPPFYTDLPNNYNNSLLDTQESMQDDKGSEEILPRPVNLRNDDDFEVSFTNNVPTIVKANPGYKLENFGSLPLMNYNSKLDTLSSYHVPHYTVTSSASISSKKETSSYAAPLSSYSSPPSSPYTSSSSSIAIEPAPPISAAKEQSDANLKAVRIWSHMSKGTAYTLHDDGTLSLEKSGQSTGYGYS